MMQAAEAAAMAEARASDKSEGNKVSGKDSVLTVAMGLLDNDERQPEDLNRPVTQEQQASCDPIGIGNVPRDMGKYDLLQQMVAERQQVEREQHLLAVAAAEAERLSRPREHFIQIASNGEYCCLFCVRRSQQSTSYYLTLLPLNDFISCRNNPWNYQNGDRISPQ